MGEEGRKIYRELADKFAKGEKREQVVAIECFRVLNDIVRPTMRDAKEELKAESSIVFDIDAGEPTITVWHGKTDYDELRCKCHTGDVLEIGLLVDSEEGGSKTAHNMREVSELLVAKTIKDFLSRSVGRKNRA